MFGRGRYDNEYEKLFEKESTADDYATQKVDKIEQEYKNLSKSIPPSTDSVPYEVNNEYSKFVEELKTLEKQLKMTRNVKNTKKTIVNASVAEKRKKLRKQIEKVKTVIELLKGMKKMEPGQDINKVSPATLSPAQTVINSWPGNSHY